MVDDEACDDAMLLIAAREQRTLTALESARFADHVSACLACQLVTSSLSDPGTLERLLRRISWVDRWTRKR